MPTQPDNKPTAVPVSKRKVWRWLNGIITAVLLVGGLWYLSRHIDFGDIWQALRAADGRFIIAALLIFILNGSLKAWRWRVLLAPDEEVRLPYAAVFWAIWLGQFVNTVLPFMRLGEIGRAYAINQQINYSKVQAISTMLIEKSLELILLGLTVLMLIPFAVLPPNAERLGVFLAIATTLFLVGMGIVTSQSNRVTWLLKYLLAPFPTRVKLWFDRHLLSGLNGLAALRSRRSLLAVGLSSMLITTLDIALPYTLFFAFSLPLNFSVAVLINVAVALVTTPPTAPGELGIFEAAVFFVLSQVDQAEVLDTAVIISYALIFHLCTLLPKVLFGGLAAVQTNWTWRQLNASTAA